ncbi:MAG: cation:proton antiporter [Candidatus Margulisbacteria bacterium]|nr:cation:proton antiporter [Candidatus Margulisiibacteriota bacterium]
MSKSSFRRKTRTVIWAFTTSTSGFLLTGIVVGPFGMGIIHDFHDIEILSEIGIVLLLFTIGMEFSLERLIKMRVSVLVGGLCQILMTLAAVVVVMVRLGSTLEQAIMVGFIISLSSTAIVLKLLQQRGELISPHGRVTLSILIFQDIAVVPMMLFVPFLSGEFDAISLISLGSVFQTILALILIVIAAKYIIPKVLDHVVKLRSQELFLLSVLVICFSVAWVTYHLGLSLALGAFLAGLILSDTLFRHQALSYIVPFRDMFMSLFFISIGMMLNVGTLIQYPGMVGLGVIGTIFLKMLVGCFVTLLLGNPLRVGILVGLGISQVGEFSLLLAKTGLRAGILDTVYYQVILAVSVVTMSLSPLMMVLARKLALLLPNLYVWFFRERVVQEPTKEVSTVDLKDHLIIIGFGVSGLHLAMTAKASDIPYVVVEFNPDTVVKERGKGEPIYFGDATSSSILTLLKVQQARVLVIAINDAMAIQHIVATVRQLNPKIYIICRVNYINQQKELYALGADEVVPVEFEASLELFSRVLTHYLVPKEQIDELIDKTRAEEFKLHRKSMSRMEKLGDVSRYMPGIDVQTVWVESESKMCGQSLEDIHLRKKYGITLLSVKRGEEVFANPKSDFSIQANDEVILMGLPDQLNDVSQVFKR